MEISDRILVDESVSGNLNAFDALMIRYQNLVYFIALHYVRERDAALDITQNVFLKAYENLHTLRTGVMFKPWLAKISYHESINWLRKNHQRQEEEDLVKGRLVPSSENQERTFLAQETGYALRKALLRLNPKYQMAVMLRYFDDMPLAEIACVLECSENLVKNILFRSLKRLKREMAHP